VVAFSQCAAGTCREALYIISAQLLLQNWVRFFKSPFAHYLLARRHLATSPVQAV
jgi:hypothetical protein